MKRMVPTIALLLAAALLTGLFAGCSNSKETILQENTPAQSSSTDSSNTAVLPEITVPASSGAAISPAVEEAASLKFSYKVHRQTIKDDDGTDLVYLKITYPYIYDGGNEKATAAINEYYDIQADNFIANVLSQAKNTALEGKKSAKEGKYNFYPHTYEKNVNIYYNENNLFSVLHTGYQNTGGAHPSSYRASETFDVKVGKRLSLSDIFGLSKEKTLEKIYETILAEIEKVKETEGMIYFESYKEDVKKYYSEEDFVLDSDGILFYYQSYAIAPYAAGMPTFKLPYEKAGKLSVSIPPIKSKELERELSDKAGRLIEANQEVFYSIFGLSMLPLEVPEKRPDNQWVFPVKDTRFKTYSEFENYIRNIYVKSEADMLLGSGRYINKDGKLYGDMSKDGGMGYNVDWNNYRYEISDISDTSATITIFTIDDSPAGKEDKTIKVKLLKENGLWLLEKMFS